MVKSSNAIYNTVGASISGVTNTLTVTNPSNTASSAARETITVGGTSAGNPTLNFNAGASNWETGLDNADSQAYKISQSTALGTKDTFIMTTAGQRTMPLQPAFYGLLSADDTNVTGNSTPYVLGQSHVLTKGFDQNSNFTTGGVFTAPVTGIYAIYSWIDYDNLNAAHNQANTYLIINGTPKFYTSDYQPFNLQNAGGGTGFATAYLVQLNATNTLQVGGEVGGGTKTVTVRGSLSFIAGFLVC